MGVSQQSRRRIANLFVAALSLVVGSRCNVYNDSLLGRDELTVGGAATMTHSGAAGTAAGGIAERGGSAGMSEAESGAGSSMGGLAEMAGAIESGGSETSGGSAGATNTTGGAKGGTGGLGGAAAGSSGASGAGGAIQAASGCAKLSVPLDDASDKAHFVISLASTADLSGATISMRFYVQAGQGGTIFNYVQDSGTYHFLGVPEAKRQPLASVTGWSTISWNVGTEPDAANTGIVKTSIKSIGIEINALPSSSWSNPTVVYVDSVTVASPTLSFTFDAANSVSTSNTAGALWLNGGASDTTATGAAVTWQSTCP
jgi:hypothetical protein